MRSFAVVLLCLAVLGVNGVDNADSVVEEFVETPELQLVGLPCTLNPCTSVCKPVTKWLSFGAFKLPYTENVCAPDEKCVSENAACIKKLQAAMKDAEDAESNMKEKAKDAEFAKGNHAAAMAAKAAAQEEAKAAMAAMSAAEAIVSVAIKEAASAAAAVTDANEQVAAKNKQMNTASQMASKIAKLYVLKKSKKGKGKLETLVAHTQAVLKVAIKEAKNAQSVLTHAQEQTIDKDKAMEKVVAAYKVVKADHLKARAAVEGANSDAEKALEAYEAAVKAHCDAESVHAAAVKLIGHDQLAQTSCQ